MTAAVAATIKKNAVLVILLLCEHCYITSHCMQDFRSRWSGGLGLEFAGLEAAEIGGGGAFEALVAVDGGVDFVIRKNEPIFGWGVLYASHFTEFQEGGCLLHGGFLLGFAGGLELLEQGHVFLDGAVDALLVEREELQLFRLE